MVVIPLLGVKTRCAEKSTAEHYEIHTHIAVILEKIVSCRHTFSPAICSRQLLFCRKDFTLNDVTVYLDLSFDNANDFPIYLMKFVDQNLNLNSLLVKRQIDNPSPGTVTGGNFKLVPSSHNLDTLSSDSTEEEIRDSGRSFQALIVWGKKLYI